MVKLYVKHTAVSRLLWLLFNRPLSRSRSSVHQPSLVLVCHCSSHHQTSRSLVHELTTVDKLSLVPRQHRESILRRSIWLKGREMC
ncbi:hypothetical protein BD324DRAFT_626479 [Kockovaella imperatae]|uniref:Uncharacterized protein n=1 Tax=Kockovaella imperatae TaxID=4999 RepID=A0A1Y1UF07_9TREE|nr:hypothetical protein BD324DRAFT_626479 [Kockovaella imperatae]ORX36602.1 hypothetical protein BD324DRAFT_626479 [Kockovaella imperatae]